MYICMQIPWEQIVNFAHIEDIGFVLNTIKCKHLTQYVFKADKGTSLFLGIKIWTSLSMSSLNGRNVTLLSWKQGNEYRTLY